MEKYRHNQTWKQNEEEEKGKKKEENNNLGQLEAFGLKFIFLLIVFLNLKTSFNPKNFKPLIFISVQKPKMKVISFIVAFRLVVCSKPLKNHLGIKWEVFGLLFFGNGSFFLVGFAL